MDEPTKAGLSADELLTMRAVAIAAGVSPTTIKNWVDRDVDALPMRDVRGKRFIRWGDFVTFVQGHPDLPAAASAGRQPHHGREAPSRPSTTDLATLRAIAQDARAAAAAASDAALQTAELHLKTVQSLRTAIAALDSALAMALASDTLND